MCVLFFLGVQRFNHKTSFLEMSNNDLQGRKLRGWRGVINVCILWHSASIILLKPGSYDVLKQSSSVTHYSYSGISSLFIVYAIITATVSLIP